MTAPTDPNYDSQKEGVPSRIIPDAAVSVTIAAGTSLSAAVDTGAGKYPTLLMPAAWTAASITFQVSDTLTGTFLDLYDEAGTEVTISGLAVSKAYMLNTTMWRLAGCRYIKVRSGTSGAPINQVGADRILKFIFKP